MKLCRALLAITCALLFGATLNFLFFLGAGLCNLWAAKSSLARRKILWPEVDAATDYFVFCLFCPVAVAVGVLQMTYNQSNLF